MDANKLYEKFEQMQDEMGSETLLAELYQAMTTDEAEANLRHIARNWDMGIFKDEN